MIIEMLFYFYKVLWEYGYFEYVFKRFGVYEKLILL